MSQLSLLEAPTPSWLLGLDDELAQPQARLTHNLRYYQEDCIARVREALTDGQTALVVMATGTGKTQCACGLASTVKGRVLFIAHRDELITQAAVRFEQLLEERVEIEQADFVSGGGRIVVASVQTLIKSKRLANVGDFEMVIVDEFHHYVSPSWMRVVKHFIDKGSKIVGLTATPDRADEIALGKLVESVPFLMDISDSIEQGWLVPVRATRVFMESIDLSGIDTLGGAGGDFVQGQLDQEMLKSVTAIVQEVRRLEPDRKGIGFFPGVASAEFAAAKMNALVPGSSICIFGKTDKGERKQLVKDFRRGRYQYLFSVGVPTEGFDDPDTSLIIQGRPTKSRSLFAQMVGRATRPPAGVDQWPDRGQTQERRAFIASSAKPDCMVLDFVGNTGKHRLATATDVLGGNYEDEVVEKARKAAEDAPGADQLGLLASAKAELEAARAAMAAQAAAAKAKVQSRVVEVDPFTFAGIDIEDDEKIGSRFGWKPVLDWQRQRLLKAGFGAAEVEQMGQAKARKVIASINQRIDQGLISIKQARALQRFAPVNPGMSFARAHQALDYIAHDCRWGQGKRVDPAVINAMLSGPREPGEEG